MAINRIRLSPTGNLSDSFVLTINPSRIELNNSDNYSEVNILDGAKIKQTMYWDNRDLILQWSRIPKTFPGFYTMLASLQSFINTVKYVNFADVEYRINPIPWEKVRIKDLKVSIESGGILKYNVEYLMQKEV